MQDKNIFQPLFQDTLYISARYLAKDDIYRFLIKISRILQQQKSIDIDLAELFEDSNWRKVNSGCLALVIASRNKQNVSQSITAAWKNISRAGQDAIPLLGSLQIADENFNQSLLQFINNGLPVTLHTPDMYNTLLFIQRQGTLAIIIQHLLKDDTALNNEISEQVNLEILDKLRSYADPDENPMYTWKSKLTEFLEQIDKQGGDALLASLSEDGIDEDLEFDFDFDFD